ncbi:MAG: DUF4625 domain-containing protein [Prevotella sp.]|nr:DUF4625 domain-containing protein [Prevotella sp.]
MMKNGLILLTMLFVLSACSSSDDEDSKDMTYPEISEEGITANPADCQVYQRGDVIPFNYVFKDNIELGSYNIEIHNNFNHHTHSTSSIECEMDEKKDPQQPWVYNQDFSIPSGKRSYTARIDIPIPSDIDAGDYHFMVRLTDRAGWQQLKAMTIKIK